MKRVQAFILPVLCALMVQCISYPPDLKKVPAPGDDGVRCHLRRTSSVADAVQTDMSIVVEVDGDKINMPLGKFLLVRRGQRICAVRFLKHWPCRDEFYYGSDYESFYQASMTDGKFDEKRLFYHSDYLTTHGGFGVPLIISHGIGGNEIIKCGPMELQWGGEGVIILNNHKYKHSKELAVNWEATIYEYSPTPWTSISEVDLSDARLNWYHADDSGGFDWISVPPRPNQAEKEIRRSWP